MVMMMIYVLIMLLCNLFVLFFCLNYLSSFLVFKSAIIGSLNSAVQMRLCQLNGEIIYIYDLTI